jgi:hypothetical protein
MDLVLGFRLFALAVAFASGLAGLLCACVAAASVCLACLHACPVPACRHAGLSVRLVDVCEPLTSAARPQGCMRIPRLPAATWP